MARTLIASSLYLQENITADNFEQVSEDLTETITTSTEDDQTEDNVAIVVNVFASTAALLDDQEIVIQQSVRSYAHTHTHTHTHT